MHCNTLQHTVTHCNALQRTATHCNALQHTASLCNTHLHHRLTTYMFCTLHLQFGSSTDAPLDYSIYPPLPPGLHMCQDTGIVSYTATHFNTLQHTAKHCNTHSVLTPHVSRHWHCLLYCPHEHTAIHCNTRQHTQCVDSTWVKTLALSLILST